MKASELPSLTLNSLVIVWGGAALAAICWYLGGFWMHALSIVVALIVLAWATALTFFVRTFQGLAGEAIDGWKEAEAVWLKGGDV